MSHTRPRLGTVTVVVRAADDLVALVLVVFTTIILAGLDEQPDAVLADGRTTTSSSAYLFLAALDADSTGVELIAVLDSIAATRSRDYFQSGRQAERERGGGSDDESMDDPGSSSDPRTVSATTTNIANSPSSLHFNSSSVGIIGTTGDG